jgi:hypothetical protein
MNAMVQWIIVAVILAALVVWSLYYHRRDANSERARIRAAHAAYQAALADLRRRPADIERQQRALELGWAYSSLTRHSSSAPLFDEIALSNDITAAAGEALGIALPATRRPVDAAGASPADAQPETLLAQQVNQS